MGALLFDIVLILLFVVINGLFALSEAALIASRSHRLQQMAADRVKGAETALALSREPNTFLSTVQIGITLLGILAGAVGGATIAEQLALAIGRIAWLQGEELEIALAVVVLCITIVSLIFGELVPKRIALANPERLACAVAPAMRSLSRAARPLVTFVSWATDSILALARVRPRGADTVTEDDIEFMIERGVATGMFDRAEQAIVERVFRLGDRRVVQVMVPRTRIHWIDVTEAEADPTSSIADNPHARLLVCDGSLDAILGYVRAHELLVDAVRGRSIQIRSKLRQPLFVPEGMLALRLLEEFRRSACSLAVVVDEYGGTSGIVTTDDIAHAIVGDLPLQDRAAAPNVEQRPDGSLLVRGGLPVDELFARTGSEPLPTGEGRGYDTVSGLLMYQLGRVPRTGDVVEVGDLRIEVVEMGRNRVEAAIVRRAPVKSGKQ